MPGSIFVEPAFEPIDGRAEVLIEGEQEVDVVEVFVAVEAVSEIVSRVDGGLYLAAVGAEEAEVAFAQGWTGLTAEAEVPTWPAFNKAERGDSIPPSLRKRSSQFRLVE